MKIKLATILTILIYHICLINLYYVDKYSLITCFLMVFVIIILISKMKLIFSKENKKINFWIILYVSIIGLSALYNNLNPEQGIIYCIKILEIFLFWEYINAIRYEDKVLNIFYKITLFYVIITDVLILFFPTLYKHYGNYLLGNKFNVSYMHIFLAILFIQLNKYKEQKKYFFKTKVILFFLMIIVISVKINCTTSIIGGIFLFILYLLPLRLKKILISSKIVIITLLISTTFLLIFSQVLQTRLVSYIIVDILHEDVTLTGRMEIYNQIFPILSNKFILGHGYGNSYQILMNLINYPNTQNGILECIFNYGIFGTSCLLIIIYNIFKKLEKNENKIRYYPIIINIYIYILLASIEITFGLYFITLLAIINNNVLTGDEKNEKDRNFNNK